MIRNGRPYTNELGDGHVDDVLVTRKDDKELWKINEWIRKNIRQSREIYERTSYSIKHDLERDTGIYLTNNEFKDAMLLAGYNPVNPDELYWKYRIVLAKEVNYNPSPFFQWVKKNNFADQSTPEGNFARSMLADFEFPVFAEYSIIMRYFDRFIHCNTRDGFKKLWKMYERKKRLRKNLKNIWKGIIVDRKS